MKKGDYVRTEYGIIKVKEYHINKGWFPEDDTVSILEDSNCEIDMPVEEFNKCKKNSDIRKIIEPGDYVNGMEVMDADWFDSRTGEYDEGLAIPMYSSDDLKVIENWLPLKYVKIENIVTHEQFERAKYIVKDNEDGTTNDI